MVTSAPLWSVLVVPAVLAGFAAVAVLADALLAAGPVTGAARLLVAQRRVTLAPDALLWRLGLWTVPAAGVLAALVIPFGTVAASRVSVGVGWFNAGEGVLGGGVWV